MGKNTKLTIAQIAKMSGVSVATVSRVLNHADNVRPETRERILKIVEEHDYVPNTLARGLSQSSSEVIGVIFPDLENTFFLAVLKGITQIAEKNGYNILIFNSDERPDNEHMILKMAKGKSLAGIIVAPVKCNDNITAEILESYENAGIPVVLLDRDILNRNFCKVLADNENGAYEAVCELIRNGHEKIAFLEGDSEIFPVLERRKGYERALEEYHIPIREEYIIQCDQKSDLAYHQMRFLMSRSEPPTAIFTSNNMMTLGCLRYLTEQGIRIGQDISIIGFDDIATLQIVNYGLSVVAREEEHMGALAMEMMLKRLQDISKTPECKIVPTRLILRGSEKYSCT